MPKLSTPGPPLIGPVTVNDLLLVNVNPPLTLLMNEPSVSTLLAAVSGIPGGIFAPSLAVGAGIGDNIAALLPALAPHSAVILLVMAAYLSGVTRAPITSFIIMMEMTNSHHMLLPLMAVTVVASGVSKLVSPTPLYHALSERFLPPPREASPVRVGELPEKMPH